MASRRVSFVTLFTGAFLGTPPNRSASTFTSIGNRPQPLWDYSRRYNRRPILLSGVPEDEREDMSRPTKRQKKQVEKKSEERCAFVTSHPEYLSYHDEEWGTPLYDDKKVFEFLILETFQAGLSWLLILRKRANFQAAFHNFDVDVIAKMNDTDVGRLMQDSGIVRNKLKIRAAISNAKAVIKMREDDIGLADYFWQWVDYEQQVNVSNGICVSKNELSDNIEKDLKKRGFKFVGSTVIYSHLQATGIINDHEARCGRLKECQQMVKKKRKKSKEGASTGGDG